jgi:uncharacterized membrane protein
VAEVSPTRNDPDLRAGSEWLGGPAGLHRASTGFWTPMRVILVTGAVTFWLGVARTIPCVRNGWADPDRYEHLCYSDIPILYTLRGLADGMVPYLEWPASGHPVEYPVLIGLVMWVTAVVVSAVSGGSTGFYLITMLVMFPFFLLALVGTAKATKGRSWDGLMLAVAPTVFLAGTINWDWPAIALTAAALWAWSRGRPGWAGVALGLAIAAKFYPVLLLGPLFVLCLRGGRLREWLTLTLATLGSWLVINVPIALANAEGWAYFFTFSADRGQDFGSFWLAVQTAGFGVPGEHLNSVATGAFVMACIGIAVLILTARKRPRVAQVSFLVVAAFLLTNKVYSPQFVLWLLPLAILARPRWRDVMWWQAAEIIYFVSIWWYLAGLAAGNQGLPEPWYAAAILVHVVATGVFAALVVRDIWRPQFDPVRIARPDHADDPGGGVLDGAPDRFSLRRSLTTRRNSPSNSENSRESPVSESHPKSTPIS